MKSLSEPPTTTFAFFLKSIYFVLEAFYVSLFALNQSAIFESSKFAKSYILFRFSEEYCNSVSSTKSIVNSFDAVGRSFENQLRINLGLILTSEELYKVYLQEWNLHP